MMCVDPILHNVSTFQFSCFNGFGTLFELSVSYSFAFCETRLWRPLKVFFLYLVHYGVKKLKHITRATTMMFCQLTRDFEIIVLLVNRLG
jgi:hypothetical protein